MEAYGMELDQALNGLGLLCGMIGTALIYFFGVPRQIDTGGIVTLSLSGDQRYDVGEQERIKRFKLWGNTGLFLVFAAFCLQFIALVSANPMVMREIKRPAYEQLS